MRPLFAIAVALLVAAPASALELPQVKTIRTGRHQSFDRVVIELDGEAPARVVEGPLGAFELELAARPAQPRQVLETGLARTGRIEILDTGVGLVLRVEPRPRRTRAFLLSNPARVVIDFADPADAAFEVPAGTRQITSAPLLAAGEAAAPPPDPEPSIPPEAPSPEPVPAPPPEVPSPEPAAEAAPAPLPEVLSPEPAAEVAPAPLPEVLSPEPPVEVVPAPLPEVPSPEPAAETPRPAPTPAVARDADWPLGLPTGVTPLLLAGAALALVVAVATWRLVRRRRRSGARERVDLSAESVAPEEIEALSRDRMELIVKRMDDEVRARAQLEEQVGELREELKVVRDQTRRLKRRGEAVE